MFSLKSIKLQNPVKLKCSQTGESRSCELIEKWGVFFFNYPLSIHRPLVPGYELYCL